jgi:hypothetical protein
MVLPDITESDEQPVVAAMEVSFIEPPQITFDLGRGPINQAFTLMIMSSWLAKHYQGTTHLTFF